MPRAKSKYVKKEMEAQALAAMNAGMVPTHFDSHQFVALQAYIMPYIQLCLKNKLAPIFIRRDRKGFEAIGGMDPGFIGPAIMMVKAFELFKIPLLGIAYDHSRHHLFHHPCHQAVPGVGLHHIRFTGTVCGLSHLDE
jgi:hypothetical protein